MNNILHAVLVLGGLGIFFGLVLALHQVFYVKVEREGGWQLLSGATAVPAVMQAVLLASPL